MLTDTYIRHLVTEFLAQEAACMLNYLLVGVSMPWNVLEQRSIAS